MELIYETREFSYRELLVLKGKSRVHNRLTHALGHLAQVCIAAENAVVCK